MEKIKSLGWLFRSLILHSDGIWTAKAVTGKYKQHVNTTEVVGNTPEEAIDNLIEMLDKKGLLKESE